MLQAAEFSPYSRVLPPEAFDNPNLNGFDKSLPDFFISPEFPFILSPGEQTLTVTLGNTTSEKAQQLLDRIAAKNSNAVLIVRLTGLIEVTHKPLSLSDRTCLIFERGGHIVAAEDCIAKSLLLIRDCQFLSIILGVRLDPLGHEVLGDNVLKLIGMILLVHDPSRSLIEVSRFLAGQIRDLLHGFFNRGNMFADQGNSHLVIVNSARDFTVRRGETSGNQCHQ
jgi:hypothetical protein